MDPLQPVRAGLPTTGNPGPNRAHRLVTGPGGDLSLAAEPVVTGAIERVGVALATLVLLFLTRPVLISLKAGGGSAGLPPPARVTG
jgi:hypothetical protein